MLASGAALSRTRVSKEQRLEFILKLNSEIRRDPAWLDYVSLSITEINASFFRISKGWHGGMQWAIAAFRPEVLEHPNVHFTTTNNIYYSTVIRGVGGKALERMFADPVAGRIKEVHYRGQMMPDNLTTDVEAEVLYPQKLSTEYLQTIYVATPEFAHTVAGYVGLCGHPPVSVEVAPDRFTPSEWRTR